MILSHIRYCLTNWSQLSDTSLQSVERLYKQSLKVWDKKHNSYYHCHILSKYHLFSWENIIRFHDIVLVYKILHSLAPPPLQEFVHLKDGAGT